MSKMNKTDFIAVVADNAGMSKTDTAKCFEAVLNELQNALQEGKDVVFPGFGTFSVNARAAREGRHPQTGEKLAIPASIVTKFKAGKGLKEAVNKASTAA